MRPERSTLAKAARDPRGARLDPWLFAALLGPLLLLPLLAGERIGEPVADDYDHLFHVLLVRPWSWFDGCGAKFYWRPLGRQAFYGALAPWMLRHPAAVALLQLAALCLAAAFLYRAFRPALGPTLAFAVSTAPWLMESSRLLVAWPGCFQDLGALLFASIALHEAVARRRATHLAAGLAALLCKEVAAVALLTTVLCPAARFDDPRERRSWFVSAALLVAVWASMYAWVAARAGLATPLPASPSPLAAAQALALVPWWTFKTVISLPPATGVQDLLLVVALVALVPWRRLGEAARERAELRAWWAWGLLWSLPLALTLVPFSPAWAPYRVAFIGLGAVAALTVTAQALHPRGALVLLALRLALLGVAPRPVREVALEPPFRGAAIDVPRLSRLQRLVPEVRDSLRVHHPRLPHGATVVWESFPAMAEYAFGSRLALCVWYRDSTLQWIPISRWMADPGRPVAAVVEFQDRPGREIALVEPQAMRALFRAQAALAARRDAESLRWLARAESLQADTAAAFFSRSIAGKRAFAEARLRFDQGRYDEARARLLELLATHPGDVPSRRLLDAAEESLQRARSSR